MCPDRRLKPRFNPDYRLDISLVQRQFFYFLDSQSQKIGVDNPNGLIERFDVGVGVKTAFSRSIRSGNDPEGRSPTAHLRARNPSGEPSNFLFSFSSLGHVLLEYR